MGDEFKGYIFRITGGNDKQGFPMMETVLEPYRVRRLMKPGMKGYRPKRKGERKRKSVRGSIVANDIAVLALIIVKQGDTDIAGLTDVTVPNPLGPKRADNIRKFFNLSKDDDVRKYVIRHEKVKNGKTYSKAPKIQRLLTPRTLEHKNQKKDRKRARIAKSRTQAKEYTALLAKRVKEAKQNDTKLKAPRLSSARLDSATS